MASRAIIPRFLLPLQGPLWRGISIPISQNILVRFASSSSEQPPKHTVLEKPSKFNPPSHGSRTKGKYVMPKHYGPKLSGEELAAQGQRNYPGVMAPEGSWSHWFWHSKLLHTFITMGALFTMAIFTFFMNYAYNSPFKDLVPPLSDLWDRPSYFIAAWKNVIMLHEKDKGTKAIEHRNRANDDVAKRRYYMKMHGIEAKDPITMVFGKDEEKSVEELEAAALGTELPPTQEQGQKKDSKKWLGIF